MARSDSLEKRPMDGNGIISIAFSGAALIAFGIFTIIFFEGFLPEVLK